VNLFTTLSSTHHKNRGISDRIAIAILSSALQKERRVSG
jgi:hypothetical protein